MVTAVQPKKKISRVNIPHIHFSGGDLLQDACVRLLNHLSVDKVLGAWYERLKDWRGEIASEEGFFRMMFSLFSLIYYLFFFARMDRWNERACDAAG